MNPFRRLIFILVSIFLISGSNGNPVSARTVTETVNGATIAVASNGNRVTVKWRGKKYRVFRLRKAKIRFISEGKLTRRMLLTRKANRIVYIERIVGRVTDDALNGKTTKGNYISYSCLSGYAHKGDEVVTWCVYDPSTKWIDDITDRFDVIL